MRVPLNYEIGEKTKIRAKINDISMSYGMILKSMLPSRTKSMRLYTTLNARKKAKLKKSLFRENGLCFMVGFYVFDFFTSFTAACAEPC